MKSKKIKVGLVGALDGIANEKRLLELEKYLKNKNYKVIIFPSREIQAREIPKQYLFDFYKYRLKKSFSIFLRFDYPFLEELKIRSYYWQNIIRSSGVKVLIMQGGIDSYVLTEELGCLKICDVPCLWSEELSYNHLKLRTDVLKSLREIEKKIYESADYVCFHWHSYDSYYKRYIKGRKKTFLLDWGCEEIKIKNQARFSSSPKIVSIGSLNNYWNNIELLAYLAKISPYPIDVYGPDKPDKKYGLNYLGYMRNLSTLARYQFGLVTISRDRLRQHGFSSRQLLYASYGLPTLMPRWRRDETLKPLTIFYDRYNFGKVLAEYSNKVKWGKKQKEIRDYVKKHTWEKTLEPLGEIIKSGIQKKFILGIANC